MIQLDLFFANSSLFLVNLIIIRRRILECNFRNSLPQFSKWPHWIILWLLIILYKLEINVFNTSRPLCSLLFKRFKAQILVMFYFYVEIKCRIALIIASTKTLIKMSLIKAFILARIWLIFQNCYWNPGMRCFLNFRIFFIRHYSLHYMTLK